MSIDSYQIRILEIIFGDRIHGLLVHIVFKLKMSLLSSLHRIRPVFSNRCVIQRGFSHHSHQPYSILQKHSEFIELIKQDDTSSGSVVYSQHDRIGVIHISHPSKKNAFTGPMRFN